MDDTPLTLESARDALIGAIRSAEALPGEINSHLEYYRKRLQLVQVLGEPEPHIADFVGRFQDHFLPCCAMMPTRLAMDDELVDAHCAIPAKIWGHRIALYLERLPSEPSEDFLSALRGRAACDLADKCGHELTTLACREANHIRELGPANELYDQVLLANRDAVQPDMNGTKHATHCEAAKKWLDDVACDIFESIASIRDEQGSAWKYERQVYKSQDDRHNESLAYVRGMPDGLKAAMLEALLNRLDCHEKPDVAILIAGIRREFAAALKPQETPGGNMVTLDEEDIAILSALASTKPRLLTLVELAADTYIGNKTLGTRVNQLIESGLVSRPKGERRGATITPTGESALESISGKTTG